MGTGIEQEDFMASELDQLQELLDRPALFVQGYVPAAAPYSWALLRAALDLARAVEAGDATLEGTAEDYGALGAMLTALTAFKAAIRGVSR
jgi:hypothetical protein